MRGQYLTKQILILVALCLFIAELLIFVPSAARFQTEWLDRQWHHFLSQFSQEDAISLNTLDTRYGSIANLTQKRFYIPDFICWKQADGEVAELGHMPEGAALVDLSKSPLAHLSLTASLLFGSQDISITVFDSQRDFDFRANWQADELRGELRSYAWRISLLTLIITLLTIMPLYLFLTRHFVRPLSSISQMIKTVSANPADLQEPANTNGSVTEINDIAAALNEMSEQVRRALRQKERLADIGEATAKINHDLRNILVSATLVTDNLSQSDDPKIRRIAPHIERAISDAANMTQNMMDYLSETKTEAPHAFSTSALAENLSHDARLKVVVTGADDLYGAADQFYRLVLNLARNAQRAGATELTIDIWRAGHLAVIDISDNGPGIADDLRPHLFSAFYSGHKRDTGLGLAIAKDLAVAMGGQLRLSRSTKIGSEFRLSVPASWLAN